jgi:hypothetical protein
MATHGPLKEVYFGFDLQRLLVRVDCEGPARGALTNYDVLRVAFAEPAGWEVQVHKPGRASQTVALLREGKPVPAPHLAAAVDQIAELAVPFDALGVAVDQHLQFFVELLQGGRSCDRAPRQGAFVLTRPSADFELIMWNV